MTTIMWLGLCLDLCLAAYLFGHARGIDYANKALRDTQAAKLNKSDQE